MKPLVFKKSRRGRRSEREPARHKLHVAKGDRVRVIRGDDRGREGKVLHVYPKQFRVVVEGVNVVKKHKRATTPQAESGIIEFPAPIAASNVMLLDPKSGQPTRVRRPRPRSPLRGRACSTSTSSGFGRSSPSSSASGTRTRSRGS